MRDVRVEREPRGSGVHWVHLYGTAPFTNDLQRRLDAKLRAEAREWAGELGMTTSGIVSSGGQYGSPWRHSAGFIFTSAE